MSYQCTFDGCTREFDEERARTIHHTIAHKVITESTESRPDGHYKGDPDGDGRIFKCVEGDCGAVFLERVARDGHLQSHGGADPDSFV